jgi:hypothetical protein
LKIGNLERNSGGFDPGRVFIIISGGLFLLFPGPPRLPSMRIGQYV